METSYSAFGASSQLAKNQLNSQLTFTELTLPAVGLPASLRDHGHGTRASPWRPLTREENFYIAFPTSLDCLSPPSVSPSLVLRCVGGGDGRGRTARGRCLDFVTRLGKQRRSLCPLLLHCSAAVSLRPLAIKEGRVESYFSPCKLLLFSAAKI